MFDTQGVCGIRGAYQGEDEGWNGARDGDGVLAEFLSIHRAEVFEVLLTEYDEQRHIADEKELSRREGKEEGRAEGTLEKAHEVAVNLFAKGISAEEAASICGEDSSLVAEWHREWEAAK